MLKADAAAYLAGVVPTEGAEASAPTNLHAISGEVFEDSADGVVKILLDGLVFTEDDQQYIEVSTLGGLEEGDEATIILSGESGRAMTPMAIGAIGSIDRVVEYTNDALQEAERAKDAADTAEIAAGQAQDSASAAAISASNAQNSADTALAEATAAAAQATRATTAANDALAQVSIIEDVSGTLSWIQSHGRYVQTTDVSVHDDKVYFMLVYGEYVPISSPDPTKNPRTEGWYTLDIADSQTAYIMAHLAVTSAGLWVLPNGLGDNNQSAQHAPGYKVLLSNDGMYLYDPQGHIVTTYGESIIFDSSRPQYIGGENAYISFYDSNDDGTPDSIRIGGNSVIFDSTPLSEFIGAADALYYDHTFETSTDSQTGLLTYTFTAYVFKGGEDVTSRVDPDFFCWWLRDESGDTFLGHGRQMVVTEAQCGYNTSILGGVDDVLNFTLIDAVDDDIVDDENDNLEGQWLLSEAVRG